MDINKVRNATLAKLDAREIGELDLLNHGVMTYRGTLKTRVRGCKTVKVSEVETDFEEEDFRTEFIKIAPSDYSDEDHWAMRIWNKNTDKYLEHLMPLYGLKFLR